MHVTSWQAVLNVGEGPGQISLELDADAGSLRVHEGHGGAQPLSEDDKTDIHKSIDDDVLKRRPVEFRSTSVEPSEVDSMRVSGELTMAGDTHPIDFELTVDSDGQLSGSATVKQSNWSIKPYSALFGALKVTDEVEVIVEASLPSG